MSMSPQQFQRLSGLFGHDLAGWQIAYCHFLELDHGLMGTFPAIDENRKIVATLNKPALEKVWKQLRRRKAKVSSIMVIANPASGVAFSLDRGYFTPEQIEPLDIFSDEQIEALCAKEGSVRWAPGLIDLVKEEVKDPVFTQTTAGG
jgi:hypothetical protein